MQTERMDAPKGSLQRVMAWTRPPGDRQPEITQRDYAPSSRAWFSHPHRVLWSGSFAAWFLLATGSSDTNRGTTVRHSDVEPRSMQYNAPELRNLGSLISLTLGANGSSLDGNCQIDQLGGGNDGTGPNNPACRP